MNIIIRGKIWYSDYRLRIGTNPKTNKPIYKRIRRPLSPNKREAEIKNAKLIAELSSKKYDGKSHISYWESFKKEYLAYSKDEKAPNTHGRDRIAISSLESHFPIQQLSDITPKLLVQLMHIWKKSGKALSWANRCRNALVAMMHIAEKWNQVEPQSWQNVKRFKVTEARTEFFSLEEIKLIFDSFDDDYRICAFLQCLAGLRISEVIHLEWGDIDTIRNRINISAKSNWHPKSFEKRSIPLTKELRDYLMTLPRLHANVLTKPDWSTSSLSHMLARKIKALDLTGSSHKFRHSYGSHNIMAGVPMKTLSIWMGHASVQTTEKHYVHLSQIHMDAEALKFPTIGSTLVPAVTS